MLPLTLLAASCRPHRPSDEDPDAKPAADSSSDTADDTTGGDVAYEFDPDDAVTKALLENLHLPEDVVRRGTVTTTELLDKGMDEDLFARLATLEKDDAYLSPKEAALTALALNNTRDPMKARALFYTEACPDELAALVVLGNQIGTALEPTSFLWEDDVAVEAMCPEQEMRRFGFNDADMAGLFFAEQAVDDPWREMGKSVVEVHNTMTASLSVAFDIEAPRFLDPFLPERFLRPYRRRLSLDNIPLLSGRGSGVIVSPEGHVLTAEHVIASPFENGLGHYLRLDIQRRMKVRYNGEDYPFTEEDILLSRDASDAAIVIVPGLTDDGPLPHVRVSKNPPEPGDPVVVIGYPRVAGDENDDPPPRLYSPGTHLRDTVLEMRPHIYYELSSRIFFGDSGGGAFNESGELIGIAHGIERGSRSYVSALPSEDSADPEMIAELDGIRELELPQCMPEADKTPDLFWSMADFTARPLIFRLPDPFIGGECPPAEPETPECPDQ